MGEQITFAEFSNRTRIFKENWYGDSAEMLHEMGFEVLTPRKAYLSTGTNARMLFSIGKFSFEE